MEKKSAGDALRRSESESSGKSRWSRFMRVFGGRSCGKRGSADYVPWVFQFCQAQGRRRVVMIQPYAATIASPAWGNPDRPCFPTSVCVCTVGGCCHCHGRRRVARVVNSKSPRPGNWETRNHRKGCCKKAVRLRCPRVVTGR